MSELNNVKFTRKCIQLYKKKINKSLPEFELLIRCNVYMYSNYTLDKLSIYGGILLPPAHKMN